MSPLWPYSANVLITLDDAEPVWVNLTHPSELNTSIYSREPAKSEVVWGASGLSNSAHRIIVSMPTKGSFIVLDTFMYEQLVGGDTILLTIFTTCSYTSFVSASLQQDQMLAPPSTIPLGLSAETSASPRKLLKRSKPFGTTNTLIAFSLIAAISLIVVIAAVATLIWRYNNQQSQAKLHSASTQSPAELNQNSQLPPSSPSTFQYPPPTSPGALNQNVQLTPSPTSALQYLPLTHSPSSLNKSVSLVRSTPWPIPPAESAAIHEVDINTPWYSYTERTVSTRTTFHGTSNLSTPEATHVETLAFHSPRSSLHSTLSAPPAVAASGITRSISQNPLDNVRTASTSCD